ncbi:MAG: siderophore staphylobactin biosynthesis protein SbnC [Pseudonocardiaceae bacterium]|nr:siderophore staphylobactin biosynthesis protein SbnC [Pseudonocardiaceae bacterium]
MRAADSAHLVLRDLVDALVQENLWDVANRAVAQPPAALAAQRLDPGERWCRIDLRAGWVCFRAREAAGLQPFRFSRAPVWTGAGAEEPAREPDPAGLLALLAADRPGEADPDAVARVRAELATAVEHAEVTLAGRARLPGVRPRPGGLLAGERLSATRDRPFHPTARAAAGWSRAELGRYGPMRPRPLGLGWVAVHRERLRHGAGPGSPRLHERLLDHTGLARLDQAMRRAGLDVTEHQPLPVHPWQFERVLPSQFPDECAAGEVVPLDCVLGSFHPTASLRTLVTAPESALHLKLSLGVATLGAARLLPARYLANSDRAQRTMCDLRERDPVLRERVLLCDERTWCGWGHPSGSDEFADRPGQLAAQLRDYPPALLTDPGVLVLPMAALAAHEWDVLGEAILARQPDAGQALAFFRELAGAFCELGLAFLRHGVMPELHGQNVLVVLRDGAVQRFVLRDHDTLRIHPEWMAAAGVPDPGYRIRPGGRQSLILTSGQALLGYLQTLGFQVNLLGIADALGRHTGAGEQAFWAALHTAVAGALADVALPAHVADVVERALLAAPHWPCRTVLGPLLRRARDGGVSMPAAVGEVPNPLLAATTTAGGQR